MVFENLSRSSLTLRLSPCCLEGRAWAPPAEGHRGAPRHGMRRARGVVRRWARAPESCLSAHGTFFSEELMKPHHLVVSSAALGGKAKLLPGPPEARVLGIPSPSPSSTGFPGHTSWQLLGHDRYPPAWCPLLKHLLLPGPLTLATTSPESLFTPHVSCPFDPWI